MSFRRLAIWSRGRPIFKSFPNLRFRKNIVAKYIVHKHFAHDWMTFSFTLQQLHDECRIDGENVIMSDESNDVIKWLTRNNFVVNHPKIFNEEIIVDMSNNSHSTYIKTLDNKAKVRYLPVQSVKVIVDIVDKTTFDDEYMDKLWNDTFIKTQ